MATRTKTTRWGFPQRLTDVATNTTLGTATRFDFAAKTIYVPELLRLVKSAYIQVSFDGGNAAALDITAWRLGIKIGSVAFDDVDTTSDVLNTGETEHIKLNRDVTAYFVTNDPGTASFNVQVGIAVATSVASNVRNISCELFVTYEYDDAATTQIKTVVFPIQGHHVRLSNVLAEVGTAGTSPAPANQIQQLTGGGVLPEGSITIRDNYIVLFANRANPGVADLNLEVRVDGVTALTRATLTAALASSCAILDIIDSSLMPSVGAAHALEARSTVNNTIELFGALHVVTYEFDPTSGTILNSVMVPLENERSEMNGGSPTGTDQDLYTATIEIPEPATITMKQTGVLVHSLYSASNINRSIGSTGQTIRPYTHPSLVRDSGNEIVHRCDHSSSNWSLSRGSNKLRINVQDDLTDEHGISACAIINYTSGKAAAGCGTHNHTTHWQMKSYEGTSVTRAIVTPAPPAIPESLFRINGVCVPTLVRHSSPKMRIGAARLGGEDGGDGWYRANFSRWGGSAEIGNKLQAANATSWFKRGDSSDQGADIEATRAWLFGNEVSGGAAQYAATLLLAYHTVAFTIQGTVSGSSGGTINLTAHRSDNGKIVATTSRVGDGPYSMSVLDNSINYYVTARESATRVGRSDDAIPAA